MINLTKIISIWVFTIFAMTQMYAQECTYTNKWFSVYAQLYNYDINCGEQMTSPSFMETKLRYQSRTTNKAQLVLLRNPYITKETEEENLVYQYASSIFIPSRSLFNAAQEIDISMSNFVDFDNINNGTLNCEIPINDEMLSPITGVYIYLEGEQLSTNMMNEAYITLTLGQLYSGQVQVKVFFKNETSKCINPIIEGDILFEDILPDFDCFPPCPPPPPTIPPTVDEECNIVPNYETIIDATIPFYVNGNGIDYVTSESDYWQYSTSYNPGVNSNVLISHPVTGGRLGSIKQSVYLNPNHSELTNPIIIVDGIDFTNDRLADEILFGDKGSEVYQTLLDGGYDIIIADFEGGADFMQANAFALIELIKQINDENLTVDAIIGPSMGGQVVRYALLYWENYLEGQYGPYDIDLFISMDSPWLGANASPALQTTVFAIKDNEEFGQGLSGIDNLINSPAARQLLIHHQYGIHLNGASGSGCGLSFRNFEYHGACHPYKTRFDDELNAMGDYPKGFENDPLKIVATVDGGGTGDGIYNPNKPLLTIEKDKYVWPGVYVGTGLVSLYPSIGATGSNEIVDLSFTTGDCFIKEELDMDNVKMYNPTVNFLDIVPGSRYNIQNAINDAGISGATVLQSFAFIPTFSALGIQTDNPFQSFTNVETPFFDAVFFDSEDSKHVDFLQQGTLDFMKEQLNFVEGHYTHCDYINDLADGGVVGNSLNVNIIYEHQGATTWYSPSQSNYVCLAESGFLTQALNNEGELVDTIIGFNLVSGEVLSDCDIPFEVDVDNSGRISVVFKGIDTSDQSPLYDCNSIQVEFCFEHHECPDLDHCEVISVDINFIPDNGSKPAPHNNGVVNISNEDHVLASSNFDNQIKNAVNVYPNPTNNMVNIEATNEVQSVRIFDVFGKLLQAHNSLKFSVAEYNTSMLYIEITLENGERTVKKVIVAR
ncbi:MAG: T9SS type A sorting domain-containing protein [Saprospiraceae bacterium]|nr:T9SS type A sorting domain-containing protein [Saprospiraceae bacterium]